MPKTLLLADDSITIQKVVGITFAAEDYKITAVDNGEDALAKARELKPDLILADVVMPRKNGYELCEAVKADPELRRIPVLLLAGTFEAFDENRARAARADGHIAKPFESGTLIARVKELVEGLKPGAQPAPRPAAAPARPAAPAPQPVPPQAARPAPAAAPRPAMPGPMPGAAPPAGARPTMPGAAPPAGLRPAMPGAPAPGARPALPGAMPPAGARPPATVPGTRPPGPGMPSPGMAARPGAPQPGVRPAMPGAMPPGAAPGARPPAPGAMPPAAARPAAPAQPAWPAPSAPAARPGAPAPPAPAARPTPAATAPPAPAAPPTGAEPRARESFGFDLGPPAGAPATVEVEEDFGDLGFGEKPGAPPAAPPEAPAAIRGGIPREMSLEEEPTAAPAPRPAPEPIELEPEEPGVVELAPTHEFVPPPAATGHRPEAARAPGDGGEAALREALSKASLEVIERVVWEVVPQLAETIIRENLERLTKQRQGS